MIASELENIPGDEPERRRVYPYYTTTEKEAVVYLTKEDIKELGFLRSNPHRVLYIHKDKPYLYLLIATAFNLSVKDFAENTYEVWSHLVLSTRPALLYSSTKPNKQDIQLIINNYAA